MVDIIILNLVGELKRYGSYVNLKAIIAGVGNSTGSSNNPTKYKTIIESGMYNTISLATPSSFWCLLIILIISLYMVVIMIE